MGDLLGYARASAADKDLALQLDALNTTDCARSSNNVAPGALNGPPGLDTLLDHLHKGDTFVVWRLDRLGRSLRHLLELVEQIRAVGATASAIAAADGVGERTVRRFLGGRTALVEAAS